MPINNLIFDNHLINHLPADLITENYCRRVENAAYSFVSPAKTPAPKLIAVTQDFAKQLGFSSRAINSYEFAQIMTGNLLLPGMQSYSLCYGGHQFGQWAGQLGDGRAINLGELVTAGIGHQILQLKGAGKTPYSRNADGLAVLRSSIREFLCSEAMFHLGIPTTRALSLCLTGENVLRDKMYDGHAAMEPCAIVCRVSPSFLRFGSFQLPASRGDQALLREQVEYSIKRDFPHLLTTDAPFTPATFLAWFSEVSARTSDLIVHWMRVGFVHGVMNTDNMSILGETIDYGPYGWIDNFDLNWTPNSTDKHEKRYCFGRQAEVGQWNLFQLANAIFPLIGKAPPLQAILSDYAIHYQDKWRKMMAAKMGFKDYQEHTDLALLQSLQSLLSEVDTDMTLFYRLLAALPNDLNTEDNKQWLALFSPCFYESEQLQEGYLEDFSRWLTRYLIRVNSDNLTHEQRAISMNRVNPKYVLRNYISQQAIELAEQGDYSEIIKLQHILQHPYQEQPEYQCYAEKRPEWAKNKFGCSSLSCSS